MAVVWTICGAGRGVGKTRLALALCELLPGAVYAKLGCGRRRADKPANLFHRAGDLDSFVERSRSSHKHIVVECNAWAREGRGDVIIYVDAVSGRTSIRADAEELISNAHIRVGPAGRQTGWHAVLSEHIDDELTVRRVSDLLAQHARLTNRPGLAVRTKIWFVAGGGHAFGAGLAALLDGIDRLGTLAGAARSAHISYRRAWDLVKRAERHMGTKLVMPQTGGVGGGRSELSVDGRRLLDLFVVLEKEVAAYASARFDEHLHRSEANGQV